MIDTTIFTAETSPPDGFAPAIYPTTVGFGPTFSDVSTGLIDILNVEQVAGLLQCSVASVRQIALSDLPTHDGPGRKLLYLRSDILRYVRNRQRVQKRRAGFNRDRLMIPSPTGLTSNPAKLALTDMRGA